MNARLFVLSGADLGRSFALADGALLGRSPECAVPLRDASISRMHAKVEARGGALWLVDQGSRNGLWRKGERVKELELGDLDEFKVGDVFVRVRLELGGVAPEADLDFDVAPKSAQRSPAAPKPAPAPSAETERPPTAVPAPQRTVNPPPRRAELELEEIVLEEPTDSPAPPAVPRSPEAPRAPEPVVSRVAPARPDPASTAFRALGATRVAPSFENRSARVLQYHRVAASGGALSADLEQRPVWVKLVLIVLAMALCAAISWFAFRGTTFLRERASGGGASGLPEDAESTDGGAVAPADGTDTSAGDAAR